MTPRPLVNTADGVNRTVLTHFERVSSESPRGNSPTPPQRTNSDPDQQQKPKRLRVAPSDSEQAPQPGLLQVARTASPADRRPDPGHQVPPRHRSDAGTSHGRSLNSSGSAQGLQPSIEQSQHPATTRKATPPSTALANNQLSQESAHRLSVQASRQLPHPAAHMQWDQSAPQTRGSPLTEGLKYQLDNRFGHHPPPSSEPRSIAARGQPVQGANRHPGVGQLRFSSPEANTHAPRPGVHPDSHSIQHPPSNAQGVYLQQRGPPGQQHNLFSQQYGPPGQQLGPIGQQYGSPRQQLGPTGQQHRPPSQLQQMPPFYPQYSAKDYSKKNNIALPDFLPTSLKRPSDHFTAAVPVTSKPDLSHWLPNLPETKTIKPGQVGATVPGYVGKYKNSAVLGCDCGLYVVLSSLCGHPHSAHQMICGLARDRGFDPDFGAQTKMCEKVEVRPIVPGLVIFETCNSCRGESFTKRDDIQMSNASR
jgi:hypothetical protein